MEGAPLSFLKPCTLIMTDTSLWGWGAHLNNHSVGFTWEKHMRRVHINILECLEVKYAILSFKHLIWSHHIALLSDNMMAVVYINCQGGTISRMLCSLSLELMENVFLDGHTHIGLEIQNVQADFLSRDDAIYHKWELNQPYLNPIFQMLGIPDIDIFTTRWNMKCASFRIRGE